jgi:hypothetical protein
MFCEREYAETSRNKLKQANYWSAHITCFLKYKKSHSS